MNILSIPSFPSRFRAPCRAAAAALAASLALIACGGGGGGSDSSAAPTGTLRLALTDAPSCGFDQVNVSIQKIRVHKSGTAADTDAGWSEIVLAPAKRVDLLTLTNGLLSELGQTALPTGKYTQMRLLLAANDSATPLANSVLPAGGSETALTVPSALQTGLKMNVDIDVAADKVADFVLDFDACRSVVKLGASGRFNLKPVVGVLARVSDATNRVVGHVPPGMAASTLVSAQRDGVPVKSTQPDSTGRFVLSPLSVGSYDIVIAAAGHATATVAAVPVSATSSTVLNASTSPIDPPLTTMRIASGTVGVIPVPASIDALVVARKAYAGGPTVEVAGKVVDGVSGAFSLSLPGSAAVKASYVAGATAISFAADTSVPAGKYTLVASSGTATKSLDVDLGSADATGLSIALP